MNSTDRNHDVEVTISPIAMASLQTQFMVGNRQFGFLHGEILVTEDTYRCGGVACLNTFYITTIVPVFDAASFQSDVLKCNDKTVSDSFRKYLSTPKTMEPILGWYLQGKPNVLLKGRDYSIHVKLIQQVQLVTKEVDQLLENYAASYAFLAAVGSPSKTRFIRDFSIGFQAFDVRNRLRLCDVQVIIVDHFHRARHETNNCLINYKRILKYICG